MSKQKEDREAEDDKEEKPTWQTEWGKREYYDPPLPAGWEGWINQTVELPLCSRRGLSCWIQVRCLGQQSPDMGDLLQARCCLWLPAEPGQTNLHRELAFGSRLEAAKPQIYSNFSLYTGASAETTEWEEGSAHTTLARYRRDASVANGATWRMALELAAWLGWHDVCLLREACRRRLEYLDSEGCEHYAALKLLPEHHHD